MSTTSDWTQTKGRAKGMDGRPCCKRGSNPAHLICYGQGYEGVQAANSILSRINNLHTTLGLRNISLGSAGIIQLVEGLDACRAVFPCSTTGDWGIDTLEAISCNIADQGLNVILGYCVRDVQMRYIQLGSNQIELRTHIVPIVNSINSSHLVSIDFNGNKLLSSSISTLFTNLDAPHLSTLSLMRCSLPSEVATPIANYLRSRRSQNLLRLNLEANDFDLQATREIIDALECGNLTLQGLNIMPESWLSAVSEYRSVGMTTTAYSMGEFQYEAERVEAFSGRNRALLKRTKLAALRCLPYARVLLNAEPPTPLEQSVSAYISTETLSTLATLHSPTTPHPSLPTFRYLDLPIEIQHHIIRQTSGDAGALSNVQFTRLRLYAEDKEGMHEIIRARTAAAAVAAEEARRFRFRRNSVPSESMAEKVQADRWLSLLQLDMWEPNTLPMGSV